MQCMIRPAEVHGSNQVPSVQLWVVGLHTVETGAAIIATDGKQPSVIDNHIMCTPKTITLAYIGFL